MSPPDYDDCPISDPKTVIFKYPKQIPAITPIQKAANVHNLTK
jgi:hypothetical protein